VRAADTRLWLRRRTADGGHGEHAFGAAVEAALIHLWIEGRDQPPRGGVGVAIHAGTVALAAQVESHPVLGPTSRVALTLGRRTQP
jgi:hypothetical protein